MAKKKVKKVKATRVNHKKGHIASLLEAHPNLSILLPLFLLTYLFYLFVHTP